MSERNPNQVEQAELQMACPTCDAQPEQWCVRWEGSKHIGEYRATLRVKSKSLHTARFTEATNAGLLPL